MIEAAVQERLEWLIEVLRAPTKWTVSDFEAVYDPSEWRDEWTVADEHERIQTDQRIVHPFTVAPAESHGDWGPTAILVGADDKRWSLTCWVGEALPHPITGTRLIPAPPEGTTIRNATGGDAAELAALERRAPLRLGENAELLMTFDRGEDYFASARLMEEVAVYVSEKDGAVTGVYWGAQQPARVNGKELRLFLEHHVRIDPDTARGGVFWALCNYGRDTYSRSADSIAFYVSPDNLPVRKFVSDVPSWSVQPLRALLPCSPAGDPDQTGRTASSDDAAQIVEILNACHRDEELFVPYTLSSLTARLERSPDQYSWSSLRIADGAVVGVGSAVVTVTKERSGAREQTCRASVLDHGFRSGAETSYRALLKGWCEELGAQGTTHLVAFTSAGSRSHDVIVEMAASIEPFDFWAFDIAEPPQLAAHGFYVDPVYF